jgi:hypothetical protein
MYVRRLQIAAFVAGPEMKNNVTAMYMSIIRFDTDSFPTRQQFANCWEVRSSTATCLLLMI